MTTVAAPPRVVDWARTYAAILRITDAAVVSVSVFVSQIAWFGPFEEKVAITGRLQFLAFSYTLVSVLIILAWMMSLAAYATRDTRVLGIGFAEYGRIVNSSLMLFGVLAILSFLGKIEIARGYFALALPLGLFGLLASRWLLRRYLRRRRAAGEMSARVLLVGSASSVTYIAQELGAQPHAGYHVLGACVPGGRNAVDLPSASIEVLGDVNDVLESMKQVGADTIVITSSGELSPESIRRLSWSLEPGRQHLVVAPGLTDIAGPRIHVRPVAGLPLVHVETPRYEGSKRAAKRAFDLVASLSLVAILIIPIAIIAVIIRLSSPGPVLFRQPRVGLNGVAFNMLKFRSMVTDAEALLLDLHAKERAEGNLVMFKMANDPRVTPVGRFLRRYSLDELPQLFNVVAGNMSLVGPRPPLPAEVELYEQHVNRRFLVKPGITGLWQVSGRSNLDWESTVRLDLYYVENWSLLGDIVILARTVRAVFHADGAY